MAVADHLRCQGRTAKGEHCRSPATTDASRGFDTTRCISHQPEDVRDALGFGGREVGLLGGRPRNPRIGAILAAAAVEEAEALLDALRAGIAPDQPARDRAKVAERWVRLAHADAVLDQRIPEAEDPAPRFDAMTRHELVAFLSETLGGLAARGELPELGEIIDGSAVELPPAEPAA